MNRTIQLNYDTVAPGTPMEVWQVGVFPNGATSEVSDDMNWPFNTDTVVLPPPPGTNYYSAPLEVTE